ncbi:MAG: ferredoxin [Planctomycetota bacterium]|nr:ferredoxin [Planctomycetota bacterium]
MTKVTKAHLVIRHKALECIGCCLCEETAPQYFRMDDNGMAELIDGEAEGVFYKAVGLKMDQEELAEAEEGCPVDIIRISAQ